MLRFSAMRRAGTYMCPWPVGFFYVQSLCSGPRIVDKILKFVLKQCSGSQEVCFCIHILKKNDFLEISFRKGCESHELCNDTSTLDQSF